MAGIKLFRTSMNGFNKTDVLTYIEELNSGIRETESNLKSRISELEEENERLGKSLSESEELVNSQAAERILTLEREKEELEIKLEEAHSRVNDADIKLNEELEKVHKSYREQIESIKNEYEEKLIELNDFHKNINDAKEHEAGSEQLSMLSEDISAKEAKIAELTEELDNAKETAEYMESRAAVLEQKLSETQDEITRLSEEKSSLEETVGSIKNQADLRGENTQQLKKRISELENRITSEKHKFLLINDKARLYDEIKSNVAKIMDDAYRDGDRIIKEAQEKAEKLRLASNEGIVSARERLKLMHQDVSVASERLADATMQMTDTFEMLLDSIELTDNKLINLIAGKGTIDSTQEQSGLNNVELDAGNSY